MRGVRAVWPAAMTGGVFFAVGGGESGYVAPHPTNTNIFFAGSYGGTLDRYDHATGQARAVNVWPDNPMGYSASDIKERFQWTFPIVFSRHDPNVLYAGGNFLFRSTDEGQSWTHLATGPPVGSVYALWLDPLPHAPFRESPLTSARYQPPRLPVVCGEGSGSGVGGGGMTWRIGPGSATAPKVSSFRRAMLWHWPLPWSGWRAIPPCASGPPATWSGATR